MTIPEPDVAAYRDFPIHLPSEEVRWEEVSPILVAEVLSAEDPDKDLVRNVDLYFQVPSIKEYWILDNAPTRIALACACCAATASTRVRRNFDFGDTFTTRLLPGFELILDPSH